MRNVLKIEHAGIRFVNHLHLEAVKPGHIKKFWVSLVRDALGHSIDVPVIVARGREQGPVVGITAALHGNEINGIPVIQQLFRELNANTLKGYVIGALVVNVPSLIRKKRRFPDGTDLNHIMPGKPDGNVSEVYAYRFFHRIVSTFDYLLDLHTASFGRINSYYIRADMQDERTARMARLQNSQIIVHNTPSDGTLRGAAEEKGLPAITLEVGDPNKFQRGMIRSGLTGIHNLLTDLGMLDGTIEEPDQKPVVCARSYWIYTDTGGILRVLPDITEFVKKGQRIAVLYSIFGDLVREYHAPENGIVIGKSISPISQTGARILHLGITE